MAHAFRVLHCLIPVALGLAPVPVASPFRAVPSNRVVAEARTGKASMASAGSSAPFASSFQRQSTVPLHMMPSRTGLNEAQLIEVLRRSYQLRQASLDVVVWNTFQEQPSKARFIIEKIGSLDLGLSRAFGACLLVAVSAACGLQWRRRPQALAEKDSQTEMTVSRSLVWPEQPTFAVAACASDVVEVAHEKFWELAQTQIHSSRPMLPELLKALETNRHPEESQSDLGRGVFITSDWRRAWHTYESPPDDPDLIDPHTGRAEYEITEIDGVLPDDLVGTMYRNGPGKFGVEGERVQHVLDSDGLVISVTMGPPELTPNGKKRKVTFRSRFVETEGFLKEREAGEFVYRGTFGTAARAPFDEPPRKGLNADPSEVPLLSRIAANAFDTKIKNSANTQVVAFGGKLLALFEAGLPYRLDPVTLETLGEDNMQGTLAESSRLPVKLAAKMPEAFLPGFLGGAAHTAHPNVCARTGRLVGWHWSQLVDIKSMEITFTEWDSDGFSKVAATTHRLDGCELAPHDMCLTENCIMLKVNALTLNTAPFLAGVKGPAASLAMDGRAPVTVHVFPRPTAVHQFEPYAVEVPACFSIHFSHGYEDPDSGNLVSFFSGWPPSDSKDFLGAWGGHSPDFAQISPTFIWRLEIDPNKKECVDLGIAPGAANACAEHPLVHPKFASSAAKYSYAVGSNVVGDSSAPCGYVRLCVEDGSREKLPQGCPNDDIDAYWFGTRNFAGEPLIVPKRGGNLANEKEAYLLGMVQDCVRHRSFVAIFDLERDLKKGPVCKLWLRSQVPHGLHGCFTGDGGVTSVFC